MPHIRFIDVIERRLLVFPEDAPLRERYMALSYIWGQAQKTVLLTSNIKHLMEPSGLTESSVSQTIEDTILLATLLSIRYLWVDALCIIQDSDVDKKAQVAVMSHIYGSAYLTVVAAAEGDAAGGLPGLRANTRTMVQEEVQVVCDTLLSDSTASSDKILSGFSLMTTLSPSAFPYEHFLEHTPWMKRGWTMQERVMSRRVLAFTKEQVWWMCRRSLFCEESYFEIELPWI